MSLTASVLTLTAISCDRFIAVLFPLRARITQQRARVVICTVWLLAIGASMPFLFHRLFVEVKWKDFTSQQCEEVWEGVRYWDPERNMCVVSYPAKKIYYTFFCVALFFLPVTVMIVTYTLLVWRLWMSKLPGERSDAAILTQKRAKKKVVKMVFIVLLVFILCWMPLQVIIMYSEYGHFTQDQGELPVWFEDVEYVAYFIAYSNSALNPVIYCGFNANFRQGLFAVLRCSFAQDFRIQQQRGKSSTMTTNAGSGRHRETPTGLTAMGHEMSDFSQFRVRNPTDSSPLEADPATCIIVNHDYRDLNTNNQVYEEVILRQPIKTNDFL